MITFDTNVTYTLVNNYNEIRKSLDLRNYTFYRSHVYVGSTNVTCGFNNNYKAS